MEKILLLNGSPRGSRSNTLMAAEALIAGIRDVTGAQTDSLTVGDLRVEPCRGCFACWERTPGRCAVRDDMEKVYQAVRGASVIVTAFPVYFFGMPGPVKNVLDRMLPMMLPYDGGEVLHRVREDLRGKRFLFVSTCGFRVTDGIYDTLRLQLRSIFGEHEPPLIAVPQAELMQVEQMKAIVDHRLSLLRALGRQLAEDEADDALLREAQSPLILPRAYQRIVGMERMKAPRGEV